MSSVIRRVLLIFLIVGVLFAGVSTCWFVLQDIAAVQAGKAFGDSSQTMSGGSNNFPFGNAATPTPTPSPTPFPTAPPPSGNPGLPKHVLTGYWQNFVNNATPLRLRDINSYYSLIAVAFATADPNTPGGVTFSVNSNLSAVLGGYTDAEFASDIAILHARGKKVIISVGGGGSTVDVSSDTEATHFADSIYDLMQAYGFDGVDIDIESGIDPASMASALRQLRTKVGPKLIITLAPQTVDMQSTANDYFQLALTIQNILTLVNTQYYNSGSMYGCGEAVYGEGTEDFLTALACIQIVEGLNPSQIGLGLPASPPGATGGYMTPTTVNQALTCLVSGQNCDSYVPPESWDIRGAMDWSINWDAANNYAFANTVGPELAKLP